MHQVLVVGAGGHAKVVIDAIQQSDDATAGCLVDSDATRWNTHLLDVPVIGSDEQLEVAVSRGCDAFVIALGATGQSHLRKALFDRYRNSSLCPWQVRHPSAIVAGSAVIADSAQMLARCVIGPSATLHENVIINTAADVEHDCIVGPHSHIAPGALLMGGVRVGTGCHVGAGAVVRESVQIGDRAIVAAGAVVVRNVAPDTVVAGVPARPMKGFADED